MKVLGCFWLFRRFMVRRVARHPLRPLLLVVAVALATTLWSAVLSTARSSVRSFEGSLGFDRDAFPLVVSPRGGRMPRDQLQGCLRGLSAEFDIIGIRREAALLHRPEGSPQPMRVAGIGAFGAAGAEAPRAPHVEAGAVLLAEELLHEQPLSPPSKVILQIGSHTLSGAAAPSAELGDLLGSHVAVVSLAALDTLEPAAVLDTLLLRPRRARDLPEVQSNLQEWFGSCYHGAAAVEVQTTRAQLQRGEKLLAAFRFNVLVLASMAVLVCALLVAQATHASLLTVGRELVILRTLGASPRLCVACIVGEAVVLGGCAAFVGVTFGYPLTMILARFLSGTASAIYHVDIDPRGGLALVFDQGVVACSIIAMTACGAVLGGLRAFRIAPMLGTRRGFHHAQAISTTLAALGAALAVGLCGISVFTLWLSKSVVMCYLTIAASVLGVLASTPFSSVVVANISARLTPSRAYLRLASGGVRYGGQRYLLGALGVALSVAIIAGLTVMVHSFRTTLWRWTETRVQGDLFLSTALAGAGHEARISPAVVRDVAALKDVAAVVPYFEAPSQVREHPVVVAATDLRTQIERQVYRVLRGELGAFSETHGCQALVSESAARTLMFAPGSSVEVEHTSCRVLAVIAEFGTEQPYILIDQGVFQRMYPYHQAQSAIVYLQPWSTSEAIRQRIAEVAGATVVVRNQVELKRLIMQLFDETFRVTGSIRWIVFGIAVLGVLVSSVQLLWERRREVKTFLVVGAGQRHVVAWFVVEGALACLGPLMVGMLGGVLIGWILTCFVNPLVFGWTLDLSMPASLLVLPAGFVGCGVAVLLLGVSTMIGRVVRSATLSDE